jgi:hypothetical protein
VLFVGSMPNNAETFDESTQLHVGDMYWKKVGSHGWVLGKLCSHEIESQTATFRLVDEENGDMLTEAPEVLDLVENPLLPANPLFRFIHRPI